MKYCPSCNKEAEDNMVFCMDCGTQLQEKLTNTEKTETHKHAGKTQLIWILLVTFLSIWAIVMTVQYIETNESKEYYRSEYREWKRKAKDLQEETEKMQKQVDFMDKYVVFVFEDNSNNYHTYECFENYDGSFWAYNIHAAESKDYTPCPDCH